MQAVRGRMGIRDISLDIILPGRHALLSQGQSSAPKSPASCINSDAVMVCSPWPRTDSCYTSTLPLALSRCYWAPFSCGQVPARAFLDGTAGSG